MTSPASLTYDSLLTDIEGYSNRSTPEFLEELPRFVMLAENRIAAEVRGLGFLRAVTDSLRANYADFAKPVRWRETYSFNIGTGATYTSRVFLKLRTYEYCRTYWPDPTQTGTPKYYADWDYNHWLIVPTPSYAFPFELLYHERPDPLSDNNQTNWTTEYQPQLLFFACMMEAMKFLKDDSRLATWQAEYDRAAKQVAFEQAQRVADRSNDGGKAG